MASQEAPPLALLAGPQLMGLFFNWSLQGVLTLQVFLYHTLFPRDSVKVKVLVYGMLIYEWVQTALVTDLGFNNFVYKYGNATELLLFHNSWFSVTIMCSLISAVVQCYFAWRIWILSHSRFLSTAIVVLSFCQMSVGIAGGIMLHVVSPSAAAASGVTPVISAWLAGAAFVDIVIAVSMTTTLWRSKTGIRKSDDMINRLVRLVVETGTLTAAVAIADVVCFTAFSSTLLHECPALVLAKLYSNTFVASLNNRAFMKMSNEKPGAMEFSGNVYPLDMLRVQDGGLRNHSGSGPAMTVSVQEETMVVRDVLSSTATVHKGDSLGRVQTCDSDEKDKESV